MGFVLSVGDRTQGFDPLSSFLTFNKTGASEDGSRILQRENGDEVDKRPDVWTSLYCGNIREEPESLFGPHQCGATETEVREANVWGLPMRDDEGCVVDPSLVFKRIDSGGIND
ncbi:hypothetical protein TNCV_2558881 [Trichonephila clavipes]|nr:hypothetical protein TNCV_2558881 [Trichonephila clavipes]